MSEVLGLLRAILHVHRLRRRFPESCIHIGAYADSDSVLGAHAVLFEGARLVRSRISKYSYVQSMSRINHADIGPFCSIAGEVIIGLGAHPTNMVSSSPVFYDPSQPLPHFFVNKRLFSEPHPKTIVGADVWIGQRAMLKAGVSIGVGAVIGAGSVVTKDVPPYTIAAGNPCRPIRLRFSEEMCMQLLDSRWWELDEERLAELSVVFSDPGKFLEMIKKKTVMSALA